MGDIDEELLEDLYGWVDQIPLSRPKKDIKRDFADGVLIAEVVNHYCPRVVEVHNYTAANGLDKKITNWKLLNRKVFKKLGFEVGDDVIRNICTCKPWAVEQFLMMLRRKVDRYLYEHRRGKQEDKKPAPGQFDSMPESERGYMADHNATSPRTETTGGPPQDSYTGLSKNTSIQGLLAGTSKGGQPKFYKGEMVPKLAVEEKEQELLAKDETIQILQAKVRRLEHLLHLKDIRIDDLQGRLDRLEKQLKPTSIYKA